MTDLSQQAQWDSSASAALGLGEAARYGRVVMAELEARQLPCSLTTAVRARIRDILNGPRPIEPLPATASRRQASVELGAARFLVGIADEFVAALEQLRP